MNASCENCFYRRDGLCKRYPPQLYAEVKSHSYDNTLIGSEIEAKQPWVDPLDWCGEWKQVPLPLQRFGELIPQQTKA